MNHILAFVGELARLPLRIARAYRPRNAAAAGKPPLFAFGFSRWKTYICDWYPENQVIFVPTGIWNIEFDITWKWRIVSDKRSSVLAWQYKSLGRLKDFCRTRGIPFHYVEDGFLRSVSLGAEKSPPISLTFDAQDMYFNARSPTDLETMLKNYDFEGAPELIARAKAAMCAIRGGGLSKYNSSPAYDIDRIYGPKLARRILVIGQVEEDASILYGCDPKLTNNDLVRLARREHPDAQIIYKPHPDVARGLAKEVSSPHAVAQIAQILTQDISLADSFKTIDHVYTITSLAGFEALMRGIKVTTAGCPFYSGWGLTDDRQPNPRRGRQLTVEQVFAAAYILYAKYIDPATGQRIEIEGAIDLLQKQIGNARRETQTE